MLVFKTFKDKIAVLTEGCKLKPFVIRHSESTRAFTHINKYMQPVYYKSSKKS